MQTFSYCRKLSSLYVFTPKNHKINLIWCKAVCWNALQNLCSYIFEEAKQKSHTSVTLIFHSHFTWIFTKALFNIWSRHSVSKLLRKNIKIATKAFSRERIISLDLKPEVYASLNISCWKVMITYCITKSYQI